MTWPHSAIKDEDNGDNSMKILLRSFKGQECQICALNTHRLNWPFQPEY